MLARGRRSVAPLPRDGAPSQSDEEDREEEPQRRRCLVQMPFLQHRGLSRGAGHSLSALTLDSDAHHDARALLRNHRSQPKMDRTKATGRLECRVCGASYETTINCESASAAIRSGGRALTGLVCVVGRADLSEPIDLFCEWVDACELEDEEQRGGAQGAT